MKRRKHKVRWSRLLIVMMFTAPCLYVCAYGVSRYLQTEVLTKQPPLAQKAINDVPEQLRPYFKELKERDPQNEEVQNMLNNYQEYPESLLALAVRNPEAWSYVYRYPIKKNIKNRKPLDASDLKQLPVLLQWDERWGYEQYGDEVMGLTGCGPTSLSMVASYLLQDTSLTPYKIAMFSQDRGHYVEGAGTSWQLFTDFSEQYGLQCDEVILNEAQFRSELASNHPIIISVTKGDFTQTGHILVLAGLHEDGSVIVHDPNSKKRTEQSWELSELLSQTVMAWSFTV